MSGIARGRLAQVSERIFFDGGMIEFVVVKHYFFNILKALHGTFEKSRRRIRMIFLSLL